MPTSVGMTGCGGAGESTSLPIGIRRHVSYGEPCGPRTSKILFIRALKLAFNIPALRTAVVLTHLPAVLVTATTRPIMESG
jgi:hypothetical protein